MPHLSTFIRHHHQAVLLFFISVCQCLCHVSAETWRLSASGLQRVRYGHLMTCLVWRRMASVERL